MRDRTRALLQAASHATNYLEGVGARPVKASMSGAALRDALGGPLADAPTPGADVIDALAAAGHGGTIATQGPRYFGFVVGGSYPVATAADWLVSAWVVPAFRQARFDRWRGDQWVVPAFR